MDDWKKAQQWEKDWWSDCTNTLTEEIKQITYAEKMGIELNFSYGKPSIDLKGKNILDLGGGVVSLLLKCINKGDRCSVVDPLKMPGWVKYRYLTASIYLYNIPAEEADFVENSFDEVWIYNCLQHTYNPKKIIRNAVKAGKMVRIFEWINTVKNEGHPQTLREDELNKWLHGNGKTEIIEGMSYSKAYYGVFPKL